MPKKYTQAQKLAYYRRKARAKAVRGKGEYRVSRARGALSAMRGSGGYYDSGFVKTMKKFVPEGTLGGVGSFLGSAAGPVGRDLGYMAGQGLAHLLGFGAYGLKRNTVAKKISEGNSPAMMHSNDASVRVRHREYITDLISSSTSPNLKNQSFAINPGLYGTFPWLSTIASAYQQYKFHGLVFYYKSLTGTSIASTTNPTMGGVILSTNYVPNPNNNNGVYVNKQQMENTQYTTSAAVYQDLYHPIECDPSQQAIGYLTVRNGAVPATSDQRIFDWGVFNAASFGLPGNSIICGEIWASYDVELCKPIETAALGMDVLTDHFILTPVDASKPLGTASSAAANSSLAGSITGAGTVYSFNPLVQEGTYFWLWAVTGSSTAALAVPAINYVGCSALSVFVGDGSNIIGTPNGSTSTRMWLAAVVNVTAMNATITFGTAGTLPTSITSGDFMITQWDYNVAT